MKEPHRERDLEVLAALARSLVRAHRPESVALGVKSWLSDELGGFALSLTFDAGDGPGAQPPVWRAKTPPPELSDSLTEVSFAIPGQSGTVGRFDCALPIQRASAITSSPAMMEAVGRIIGLACAQASVVTKVSTLSRSAIQDNRKLKDELRAVGAHGDIVAKSPAMQEVLHLAEIVAPHATTALLRGESGTGKEVIARHIHNRSGRKAKSFIAVNCAAIPESLVESELFGHEQGSFTGASRQHRGRFERADGGTLLLDEVAELPLAVQAKLLRVLQEGTIERVGGTESIAVDVRVIAATHQPLEQLIEEGAFRADLFYRLCVFPIVIPPLRERPEDLLALVDRQLRAIATRLGEPPVAFDSQQIRELLRAPWPGNVRQLMNEIERAVIMGQGSRPILPPNLASAPDEPTKDPTHTPMTLDESTSLAIASTLRATRGKLYGPGGAAEQLGVKPSTLQAKMTRLGLRRADFAP